MRHFQLRKMCNYNDETLPFDSPVTLSLCKRWKQDRQPRQDMDNVNIAEQSRDERRGGGA